MQNAEESAKKYLVFDIAPDLDDMTAYSDPRIVFGNTTYTLRKGPMELTQHPGKRESKNSGTYFRTFEQSYRAR